MPKTLGEWLMCAGMLLIFGTFYVLTWMRHPVLGLLATGMALLMAGTIVE